MNTKVTLLILLSLIAGCVLGMVEAWMGFPIWPMAFGLAMLGIVLVALGRWWLTHPIERLAWQLEVVARLNRPGALNRLPIQRRDEIGQLARIMQGVGLAAAREGAEARQLRRTLDARVSAETKKATQQLRQIAMRDALTGLGNRRFLEESLDPLVDSCRASGSDLVCLAMDMDNFKRVNDTLGHDAGDELLIFFANLVRSNVRRDDYAVRLGGDEFLVLLPGGDLQRASRLAERLLSLYRQHMRTAYPPDLQSSLSIGASSLSGSGVACGRDLLKAADQQLYEAKRCGKNRVAGCA